MIRAFALVALAAPLSAAAQEVPPGFAATYLCAGNAVLQVAYLNPETGPSLAVVNWAGKLVPMRQGPSGSGVRYIAFDEQESYRWHTKGPEGTLLFLAADHTAEEQVALAECRQVGD